MNFTDELFLLMLFALFAIYYILPLVVRPYMLLGFNLFFYACWGVEKLPFLLLSVAITPVCHNRCQDASCAAENILLAAHSMGLGATWLNVLMTLREVSPVKELLDVWGIPETHNVWSMIALGYPAEVANAPLRKSNVVHYV